MKKILLICLVSLLCNIGIFSNVANAEETVSADSVNKVVYNENTYNEYCIIYSKVDNVDYVYDSRTGNVCEADTGKIVGAITKETQIIEEQFTQSNGQRSTNGYYYYHGVKIADHYVYSYKTRYTAAFYTITDSALKSVLISVLANASAPYIGKLLSKVVEAFLKYYANNTSAPKNGYVDVRMYANTYVLSNFATITEAIGPEPSYQFMGVLGYDSAIGR